MHSNPWTRLATAVAFLALSACSATQARIDDNQELYDSYPPEVQAFIKSNRIDKGFDKTQVYLALGNADRTELVEDTEVWYYHVTHNDTVREEKSATEYRAEMYEYERAVAEGVEHATPPETYRTFQLFRTRIGREVHFEGGLVSSWSEPEEKWIDEWHSR